MQIFIENAWSEISGQVWCIHSELQGKLYHIHATVRQLQVNQSTRGAIDARHGAELYSIANAEK